MCAYCIEDNNEFNTILYEAKVHLLDGSLETNKTNNDPDMTAESVVRPPTHRRQVKATLAVAEGSYGTVHLGWGLRQEPNTYNTITSL